MIFSLSRNLPENLFISFTTTSGGDKVVSISIYPDQTQVI